jgi:hypothetical protein
MIEPHDPNMAASNRSAAADPSHEAEPPTVADGPAVADVGTNLTGTIDYTPSSAPAGIPESQGYDPTPLRG